MHTIYVYVLETLADWELGNITAELNSKRFFKKEAPQITVKTVSLSTEPIHTMGGMTILPDCTVDEVVVSKENMLILPGADTWSNPIHQDILSKAKEFLQVDASVCAICGATVALANIGLLDERPHTSNGNGFLEMFCPAYKGQKFYMDEPSVADGNLITASCTGSLLFAKNILTRLDVFSPDTMSAWYDYFSTGKASSFFALMQSVSPSPQS